MTFDFRAVTKTPTQASLLRLIVRLHKTTKIERDGRAYLAIQLDRLAEMVGLRARSSVYRALEWLKEQGFIQIVRDRFNRSPRLYLRPLIKPRATSTQRETTVTGCADATCSHNPSSIKETIQSGAPAADAPGTPAPSGKQEDADMPLRGPLKDAGNRIETKAKAVREAISGKGPEPALVAHEWVRLLAQYGYPGFPASDVKNLAHIRRTIDLFGSSTVAEFVRELERRIGLWQNTRPDRLRKTPPHPWAMNRLHLLFTAAGQDTGLGVPVLVPEPLATDTPQPKVDEAKPLAAAAKPVLPSNYQPTLKELLAGKGAK
jgi:hypothetical protein